MKSKRSSITIIGYPLLTSIIGFTIGFYFFGSYDSPKQSSQNTSQASVVIQEEMAPSEDTVTTDNQQQLDIILRELASKLSIRNPSRKIHELYTGMSKLPYSNLKELIELNENGGLPEEEKDLIRSAAIARMTELDASNTWFWMQASPWAKRNDYIDLVMKSWAEQDIEQAANYVRSLNRGKTQNRYGRLVAEQMAKSDAAQAIQWAEGQILGNDRHDALTNITTQVAATNPQEAINYLDRIGPNFKNDAIVSISYQWAKQDPQAALNWAWELPESLGKYHAIHQGFHHWMERDSTAAVEYIRMLQPDSLRDPQVVSQIAMTIGFNDPIKAFDWIAQAQSQEIYQHSVVSLFQDWAYRSPDTAWDFAQTLVKDSPEKHHLLNYVAEARVSEDYQGALDWATSLPLAEQETVMRSVVGAIAMYAPEQALAYFDYVDKNDPKNHEMEQVIAHSWANSNPLMAVNWVNSMPASEQRATLLGTVLDSWTESNPNAAINWIKSLPTGMEQNTTMFSWVSRHAREDIPTAMMWAKKIQDPILRYHALSIVEAEKSKPQQLAQSAFIPEENNIELPRPK